MDFYEQQQRQMKPDKDPKSTQAESMMTYQPLLEAISKRMNHELGNANVKDTRFNRLLHTAVISATEPITRDKEVLKKTFNELQLFEVMSNPQTKINKEDLKIKQDMKVLHFCKFSQLLTGSNNLSGEVLCFYLKVYHGSLEPQAYDEKTNLNQNGNPPGT